MTDALNVNDEAVVKATGRTSAQWFEVLDKAEATKMKHPDIARYLSEQGVPGWWCQMITVTYEQARAMRKPGQRPDGTFSVSASKSIPTSLSKLYAMFESPHIEKWLDKSIKVSTVHQDKSIRGTLEDGSKVELGFYSKGDSKAMVALENSRLPNQDTADERKKYWKERLEELAKLLA